MGGVRERLQQCLRPRPLSIVIPPMHPSHPTPRYATDAERRVRQVSKDTVYVRGRCQPRYGEEGRARRRFAGMRCARCRGRARGRPKLETGAGRSERRIVLPAIYEQRLDSISSPRAVRPVGGGIGAPACPPRGADMRPHVLCDFTLRLDLQLCRPCHCAVRWRLTICRADVPGTRAVRVEVLCARRWFTKTSGDAARASNVAR
ncbi:hypothetical protein C8R44DRAFT_252781 [Mycena epipterygia]|nr:hypothetical protein C8R44DRAFT_252781 [Mycena epipterygia]